MSQINVMINGLPGNVAMVMARFGIDDNRFNIIPFSLTGQEIEQDKCVVHDVTFELIKPDVRDETIKKIRNEYPSFICIDYTHPTAVNDNAVFYTSNHIPFVMGTTGGDREALETTVKHAENPAVIAPNMAKQIVGFQAMMEYGAKTFPGLFKGFTLKVVESHQAGKADTSGTAKAVVKYFNEMGIDFDIDQIEMERNPEVQENEWKIPSAFIGGHAWHTYTLNAPNGSALFEFKHNINGRDIYANGTFDAVLFLNERLKESENNKRLYTMIDVLSKKEKN